jgi:hypothetical protein
VVLCTCLSTIDALCQSATRRSGPGGCCGCLNKPCEAKKLQHTCSLSTSCSTSCLSRAAIVSFRARATLLVSSCSACMLSCSRLELPVLGTAGSGSCNQQYVLTVLVSLLGCGMGENTAHVFLRRLHMPFSCIMQVHDAHTGCGAAAAPTAEPTCKGPVAPASVRQVQLCLLHLQCTVKSVVSSQSSTC